MSSLHVHSRQLRCHRVLFAICLGIAFFVQLAPAASVDPVKLVSKTEATALLGQPVTAVTPASEQVDEDTGGKLVYCAFRTEKSAIVVSVVSFASAQEALAKMTKQHAVERLEGDNAQITRKKSWETAPTGPRRISVRNIS